MDETSAAPERTVTYELEAPVHAELVDPFGERFVVDLEAGAHAPMSEREELALEHLVALGMATKAGRAKGRRS